MRAMTFMTAILSKPISCAEQRHPPKEGQRLKQFVPYYEDNRTRRSPQRLDTKPHPKRLAAGKNWIIMPIDSALPPFGWYPDPAGTNMLRWWDGSAWTNNLERRRPEVQSAEQYSTLLAS